MFNTFRPMDTINISSSQTFILLGSGRANRGVWAAASMIDCKTDRELFDLVGGRDENLNRGKLFQGNESELNVI